MVCNTYYVYHRIHCTWIRCRHEYSKKLMLVLGDDDGLETFSDVESFLLCCAYSTLYIYTF